MNDQDITAAEGFGKDAVRLDEGHVVGQGGIPDRFENPGLPPHVPRGADLSEAAAKRAEKQVAGLFTLSIVLGRGVSLWEGLEGLEDGYDVESIPSATTGVMHLIFRRKA